MKYQPFDVAQLLFLTGMISTTFFSIALMIQLTIAGKNPSWDVKNNKEELEKVYSKENAKQFKLSYYGARLSPLLCIAGLIAWFIERAIRF